MEKSPAEVEYNNTVAISLFVSSHITPRAPSIRYSDYSVIELPSFTHIFSRGCSTSSVLTPIVLVAGSLLPSVIFYLYGHAT